MSSQEKKTELTEKKQRPDHLFKPGQSGNPAGRPKGSISLVTEMKKKLEEIHPMFKKTYAQAFIESILDDALTQDGPSRKLVMQYMEGLPVQKQELTHTLIPKPLDDVRKDDSLQEDKADEKENKSITGGNGSEQDDKRSAIFDSEVSM